MKTDHRKKLKSIRTFPALIDYLREELDWPINSDDLEMDTFPFTPEELGIEEKVSANIQSIRLLRPFTVNQPWGIFFIEFEPKRLPVVALRRILGRLVLKKRASANSAERTAWEVGDLLFITNYGEGEERRISLAHFTPDDQKGKLPTLKVLGWDNKDTPLHLDHVADTFREKLVWPSDEEDIDSWRRTWQSAFEIRHREVITTSKALSFELAQVAKAIRDKIRAILSIETENGPITKLLKAFQEALIHDLDADGFADMYAQTIAYGLLSARITRREGIGDVLPVTNPFLRDLMETFMHPEKSGRRNRQQIDFDELGVNEVVDLLNNDRTNIEAVLRDFGDQNPQEDPVIHFYEHFLSEYDKEQKISRGVFYTPRPVVSFIVRSVDELLRTEFGLEDGLADTTTWGEMAARDENIIIPSGTPPNQAFVQILDPATGTGTFLVEVIDLIHKTMIGKWMDEGASRDEIRELWNSYVPEHLLPSLHGYELLMAPYVIAHLKIGLKLFETGYHFGSNERTRVYLTNALEPASDHQLRLDFLPSLAKETRSVNEIKSNNRFTVIVGNPPYAGISSNRGDWITKQIDRYRYIDSRRLKEKKIWIKNDYVKFLRLAEYQITRTGAGIIGYITDHSYLDSPTFRGLRWSILNSFSQIHIFNLHGNSKRRERTPEGDVDENVFDITQGTAINISVKKPGATHSTSYLDLWGTRQQKSDQLAENLFEGQFWEKLSPEPSYYMFVPLSTDDPKIYESWWKITDVLQTGSNGIQTSRDSLVVAASREALRNRFASLRHDDISNEEVHNSYSVMDRSYWNLKDSRKSLREDEKWEERIVPYLYRPFDSRWLYASKNFVHRLRREVMQHLEYQNLAISVGRAGLVVEGDWDLIFASNKMCDHNIFYRGSSQNYPLYIYSINGLSGSDREHNLSPIFCKALAESIATDFNSETSLPLGISPESIFTYIYAVFHSKRYRFIYEDLLRIDYPHLPLPGDFSLYSGLSNLGEELVDFHLLKSATLNDVSTTLIEPSNTQIGSVGWSDGTVWLNADEVISQESYYASRPGTIGITGVPKAVWDFKIGGYQVCHKWLKDRKGRTLSEKDIEHYQKTIVAIRETIRIMGEIDEVIEAHGGWPDAFVTKKDAVAEEKVILFPGGEEAEAAPLRKAAEERGDYEIEGDEDEH